jgi:predicted porin
MRTTSQNVGSALAWMGVALAGLAVQAPALAQEAQPTTVQLYGIIDTGIQIDNTGVAGAGWIKKVTPGNQWASRLGVKGNEDLGGGLQAEFNIETGISSDSGDTITYGTTAFWARRSVVGIKGGFGELLLGRDYTPGFWSVIQSDRNRYGLPGTVSLASQLRDARADNGIFYNTPFVAGFVGRFALALGEGVVGRLAAGSVDYRSGPLYATVALQRREALLTATSPSGHNNEGGAGIEYTIGSYVVNAGYWATDPVAGIAGSIDRTRAGWLGGGFVFGNSVVYAQVAKTKFTYVAAGSGSAVNYGVSYNYNLSKRTNLYASYGGVSNDSRSNMALSTGSVRTGGTVFGADPKALVVGIKHSF